MKLEDLIRKLDAGDIAGRRERERQLQLQAEERALQEELKARQKREQKDKPFYVRITNKLDDLMERYEDTFIRCRKYVIAGAAISIFAATAIFGMRMLNTQPGDKQETGYSRDANGMGKGHGDGAGQGQLPQSQYDARECLMMPASIESVVIMVNGKEETLKLGVTVHDPAPKLQGLKPDDMIRIKSIKTSCSISPELKVVANVRGLVAADGNINNPDDTDRRFLLRDIDKDFDELTVPYPYKEVKTKERYTVRIEVVDIADPMASFITQNYFHLEFCRDLDDMIKEADNLNEAGKPERALAVAEEAAKMYPQSTLPHNRKDIILLQMEDYKGALKEALKALEMRPDSAILNHNVGLDYLMMKDCKKAVVYLTKAVELDHNSKQHGKQYKKELDEAKKCAR